MQGEQGEAKTLFGKETGTDVSWGDAMFDHFYCLVFHCSITLCLSVLVFFFVVVLQHDCEVVFCLLHHGHREVFFHAGVL